MKKIKLKSFASAGIYVGFVMVFCLSLYGANLIIKNLSLSTDDNTDYVDNSITNTSNNYIPVVASEPEIVKPFTSENVSIYKDYYDYEGDNSTQEEAIIYYGNTYMQNSGIDYKSDSVFDIISILDGEVVKVYDNEILGTSIEIKHSNDIVSVYQALGEVLVNEGDSILQGQVIAKSGKSNIYTDVDNGFHFELSHNGAIVNPSNYFNKTLGDL